MLSPAQVMFREAWERQFGRELELSPVEGGFAHLESRTLILLNRSHLESQANDCGWVVRQAGFGSIAPLAADIRRRMARGAA